jgi:hypothetical protein
MKYENEINEKKNTPSTQINTIYILRNPIREKSQVKGEAYALSFYSNANTKKEALTSFDIVACMVVAEFILLFYSLKILLLHDLLNYGTNTMLMNGTPFLLLRA